MTSLLDEVLEAHGGPERWSTIRRITARERVGGLLPRTRMPGNRFADVKATLEVEAARVRFDPFPGPGRVGVFEPGEVRIETADGEVLESRTDPRKSFSGLSGLRRNLRWDALDSVYFGGSANHNYLTAPFLFTLDGVEVSEGEPWEEQGEVWQRLEVTFPEGFDTHSRGQTFYYDAMRLLRRQDYVAEPQGLTMAESRPVLWHIPVSHYSEKVRWALAQKSVDHQRRAPLPGAHMAYARHRRPAPVLALSR